jgi:hypothetical protein
MVNQDTDIVALMDIATLVHDTEYKTKQSFGESDPQRLTSGSVPFSALVSQQQPNSFAPFCMGYILSNGSVQKSLNLGSLTRTGTGYYLVRFNTPANDNKYIIVFGNQDIGDVTTTNTYVAQNSRTVNGFDVRIWGTRGAQDEEFNFVVYAF